MYWLRVVFLSFLLAAVRFCWLCLVLSGRKNRAIFARERNEPARKTSCKAPGWRQNIDVIIVDVRVSTNEYVLQPIASLRPTSCPSQRVAHVQAAARSIVSTPKNSFLNFRLHLFFGSLKNKPRQRQVDAPTMTMTTPSTNNNVYLQEEQVANEFGQVIQKRRTLVQGGRSGSSSLLNWSDRIFILQNLQQWQQPLCVGLAVGCVALLGCHKMRQQLLKRQKQPFSPFRRQPSSSSSWVPLLFVVRKTNNTVGLLDLTLSGWLGFQAGWWTIDSREKQKLIAQIPLQTHNSNISHQLCATLIQEYQRQWKNSNSDSDTSTATAAALTRRHTLQQPRREDLQVLFQFIRNCQTRHQQRQTKEREGASSGSLFHDAMDDQKQQQEEWP